MSNKVLIVIAELDLKIECNYSIISMRVSYSVLAWLGLIIWLLSLIVLPFFKLHIPNYLWIFPVVTIALMIAYRVSGFFSTYITYAIVGIVIIYLVFTLIIIKLWLYFVAGIILLGLFIMVFQWMMGREWGRNPFAWLILIVLLIIVAAIGGAIVGPILVLVAQLLDRRRGS